MSKPDTPQPQSTQRLESLDVYRGFTMMVLVSYFFGLGEWFKGSRFEELAVYQTSHVTWTGCSLWDLIQPSFMFIVGVAMPYSYASRKAKGDGDGKLFLHALKRALILILLGVFLRSNSSDQTYWTFEDVISQIGLGYVFVFLTLGKGIKVQAGVTATILIGYYALFALWPLPAVGFTPFPDSETKWEYFTGFTAHWNKGANPLGYFDAWFLDLFPRANSWDYHSGGYGTLSFIPSMATILFGVMTGEFLKSDKSTVSKFYRVAGIGGLFLIIGMLLDGHIWPGAGMDWSIAPIVKRIWTPSFAIFSTGWTLIFLSGFILVIDIWKIKEWAFPFIIVGMNPLTIYCMETLIQGWLHRTYSKHFHAIFEAIPAGEIIEFTLVILTMWAILFWMYRKKIFIRI